MRMPFASFLLLTSGICLASLSCSGSSRDLDALISAAVANDEYVISGTGTITFEDFLNKSGQAMPGKPASEIKEFEKVDADYAFDGEKRYAQFFFHGRGHIPYLEVGYDGRKMWRAGVSLDEAGEIAVKSASSMKRLRPDYFEPDRFDPRFNGLRVMDNPIGALLATACADTSPAYRVTRKPGLRKDETIDGIPCKVVTFTQKNVAGQNTECTLWLAPSLRYRAVQILLNTRGSAALAGKEALNFRIAYRTLENGIPFPASIELKRSMNGRLYTHRKTVFHPDWRVNTAIPDSTFQLGNRSLERKEFKASAFILR